MTLHPVTDGPKKNRFCGPSALSAITGLTTDDTAAILRDMTGRRQVTGVTGRDMRDALWIIDRLRLDAVTPTYPRGRGPTLAAWLRESKHLRTPGRVFLVGAGWHWQVISGRRFVDSKTREIVSIRDKRAGRRRRVEKVWEVVRVED